MLAHAQTANAMSLKLVNQYAPNKRDNGCQGRSLLFTPFATTLVLLSCILRSMSHMLPTRKYISYCSTCCTCTRFASVMSRNPLQNDKIKYNQQTNQEYNDIIIRLYNLVLPVDYNHRITVIITSAYCYKQSSKLNRIT